MAGNIIPAIATTNAVIAGLIVLEGLKVLTGKLQAARTVSMIMELAAQATAHFLVLIGSDMLQ